MDEAAISPNLNQIILQDDYIDVTWNGRQTKETVLQSNLEVEVAAEKLVSQGKPVLVSFCIKNHPVNPDIGAFKELLKEFDAVKFDRIALFGDFPGMLMSLITSITDSFQKSMEIKHFADKDSAIAWLKSNM